jgi:hypothetical protein
MCHGRGGYGGSNRVEVSEDEEGGLPPLHTPRGGDRVEVFEDNSYFATDEYLKIRVF